LPRLTVAAGYARVWDREGRRRLLRIRFKEIARALLPPVLSSILRAFYQRSLRRDRRPRWEYVPEGWTRERVDSAVKGWNVQAVQDRHAAIWPKWTHALIGTGPLGIDFIRSTRGDLAGSSLPTDLPWAHNAVISYGYVLALAARFKRKLAILDWGGGIGQFLPLSRALLSDVEIEYHTKDVPLLCKLGRRLNPGVVFHEGGSWQSRSYDLVIASSALQLAEDWPDTLAALAAVAAGYLFVTRVPIVVQTESFVVLQRAYDYGFETEFLGWFLNRSEFLEQARVARLKLVREFVMMDQTPAQNAPEQATYRGFLFKRG
jgi:putative methyltransferase (TIGR04325 family)